MIRPSDQTPTASPDADAPPECAEELRAFMAVVYRALLMIIRYLQKRYGF